MSALYRRLAMLFMIILSTQAIAQDSAPLDEILSLMPAGVYSEFGAFARSGVLSKDTYADYQDLWARQLPAMGGRRPPLPEALLKDADYTAYGRYLALGDEREVDAAIKQLAAFSGKDATKDENVANRLSTPAASDALNLMKSIRGEGGNIWVVSIPAGDILLREAEQRGLAARTGKRLFKRPIYAVKSESGAGSSGAEVFVYASSGGVLLVADQSSIIRRMELTARGRALSVLDSGDFDELLSATPTGMDSWRLRMLRKHDEYFLKRMNNDWAVSTLERLRSDGVGLGVKPEIEFVAWCFADDVRRVLLYHFSSAETTEAYAKKSTAPLLGGIVKGDRARRLAESQEVSVSGATVTATRTVERKELDAMIERLRQSTGDNDSSSGIIAPRPSHATSEAWALAFVESPSSGGMRAVPCAV